jgi:hypothetical protein
MAFSPLNNLLISVEKQGPGKIKKDTFPFRYGKYSEIKTKVRNAFFHVPLGLQAFIPFLKEDESSRN